MPPMGGDVRWHHGQTLAAGQVAEFKVWAELVRQSMGGLHVFLPLRDVGIDGRLDRYRVALASLGSTLRSMLV